MFSDYFWLVFSVHKMGTLARNGLIYFFIFACNEANKRKKEKKTKSMFDKSFPQVLKIIKS